MASFDTRAAWTYHDSTKHSLESVQSSRHVLDWPNKPLPFKIYPTLEPIPLPRAFPPSDVSALVASGGHGRLHQHFLAQRLEVRSARLPPQLLGHRNDPGEPLRRRRRERPTGATRPRVRRRRRERSARPEPRQGSGDLPRRARPGDGRPSCGAIDRATQPADTATLATRDG